MPTRPLLAAVVLAALACQSGSQPYAHGLSAASTIPPSSLLRLPAEGGPAALYHVPGLEPWDWRLSTPMPALRRMVGADLDQELVYALTARNEVIALDLQTARPRPVLAQSVREVTIGPDGTLFTVDDSLRVVQFVRRNPVRFATRLPARPRDLFGTRGAALIAISAGTANGLTLLHPGEPPKRSELPTGDAAATFWGDLLAIAADSAVILTDPEHPDPLLSLPIDGHARAVLFSPSGHRFYVARREGGVLVYNRFTRQKVGEIDLPGPAGALRVDPFGRWLLVHPTGADSLWLVDLATDRYVGGFAADWSPDLPTVTNQQTLLLKLGRDVVAYDLTNREFPESGRVADGSGDFWLPLAWTPETGTASALPETAADTTTAASPDEESASRVYLQVSSSQNRAWSDELARQLTQQGLPASVLEPRAGEEGFRVVLGPYPTREVAESTGRRLGRPFFLYQPDR
ncbi:MAG: SPOR domain-containing protein [Gemmatimonadales bacterium]|nr:SPOR domain-containing protein [Gemmatimonadales bacterium]